jgi:Family of unknown function (DUF5946)
MSSELDAYHELSAYTLTHGDLTFIHQHVVDAWAAQHADEGTKPIGLTFGLVGLYLHLEKGFSGRRVQRAHMEMARRKREWPAFALPAQRGRITAIEVMAAPEGPERDQAIDEWCRSVWNAFAVNRPAVEELLRQYQIV